MSAPRKTASDLTPPRRAFLAAIAGAPALALVPGDAAFSPLDMAVIAEAIEVRRLMREAEAAWRRYAALDHERWKTSRRDLGPRPEIDGGRVADVADEMLAAFGDLADGDIAEAAAAWDASNRAIADRLGVATADARVDATAKDASEAMARLGAMPVASLAGIAAKASVFRVPHVFDYEDYDHRDLALAVLRDLGCAIAPEDADV